MPVRQAGMALLLLPVLLQLRGSLFWMLRQVKLVVAESGCPQDPGWSRHHDQAARRLVGHGLAGHGHSALATQTSGASVRLRLRECGLHRNKHEYKLKDNLKVECRCHMHEDHNRQALGPVSTSIRYPDVATQRAF